MGMFSMEANSEWSAWTLSWISYKLDEEGEDDEDEPDYLVEKDSDDPKWNRMYQNTVFVLERAQHHQLSLEFTNITILDTATEDSAIREATQIYPFNAVLKLLCDRAEQWKSLTMSVGSYFLSLPAFREARGSFSGLQRLDFDDYSTYTINDKISDSLGPLPALRVLQMDISCFFSRPPEGRPHFDLPYDQLKSITLSTKSYHSSLPLISNCPNITFLSLQQIDSEGGTDNIPVQQSCRFPCLRSLRLFLEKKSDVLTHILPHMDVPSLHSLALYGGGRKTGAVTEDAMKQLFEFVKCTMGNIEALTITGNAFSVDQVVSLLDALPNLRSLVSRAHAYTSKKTFSPGPEPFSLGSEILLDRLRAIGDTSFLPHLARINGVVPVGMIEQEEFADAIRARWYPGTFDRIRSVKLEVNDFREYPPRMADGLSELLLLRNEGLRISVKLTHYRAARRVPLTVFCE